jgi:hypothetical protein
MKKGLFDVKVIFMITLCFIVREQGWMEWQVVDPFVSFGQIIGVARLHPFLYRLFFSITPPVIPSA